MAWAQEIDKSSSIRGHNSAINAIAFSPNGKSVLTGGSDATARLWDTSSGQLLYIFEGHDKNTVTAMAFAVRTGQVIRRFSGHTQDAICTSISPDGTQLLMGVPTKN